MIGQLPQNIEFIVNNKINKIELSGYLPTKMWTKGRKYEENTLVIDLRQFDSNGTLNQAKELEPSTNKYISTAEVISGCLVIRLKRELP